MQTRFTLAQLADPDVREADAILRKCVHCGFCNATCPTFRILGDELDGPRGRIYLVKEMLERETRPGAGVARHLDRCLSCLACMSTCPSGVDYMHLVDHARHYLERHHTRRVFDRLLRRLLAWCLTDHRRFAALLPLARLAAPLRAVARGRLNAMLRLAGSPTLRAGNGALKPFYPAEGRCKGTIALLPGCVQRAAGNEINHATIRLLNRFGYPVRVLAEIACCGAIDHHLGDRDRTLSRVRCNLKGWQAAQQEGPFAALVVNASGCGTMLKDYAHLLRDDARLAPAARALSDATLDISAFLVRCGPVPLPRSEVAGRPVAYQNPCSMRHGQKIVREPAVLLRRFGFDVREPPEDDQCCGSAGTYNLLQPDLAETLGRRKAQAILSVQPRLIASGNLGCILQLRSFLPLPIVHTAQLLDWASGGPPPPECRELGD